MKRIVKRVLLLFIIISLLAGSAVHAGQRIGTRRALLAVAEEISYLLRATFTATDQGYSDDQVVDDPSEGIEDGQLTIVEDDGTLAIVSNKCAFTAQDTPTWNDLALYSQAIAKVMGRGLLYAMNVNDNTKDSHSGWVNAMPDVWAGREYTWRDIAYGQLAIQGGDADDVKPKISYAASTDYALGIVLGGFDSNKSPWYPGQIVASYLYGAAFFIKGGVYDSWTLITRLHGGNSATLYAAFNNYTAAGTLDNFRVPDADLSAVLQPTCLSTFTADNGTSLDAITPEVGGVWTEQAGSYEIQGNRAQPSEDGGTCLATIDTGISDCLIDVTVQHLLESSGCSFGVVLRYSNADNLWRIWLNSHFNSIRIHERAGAVTTERASTDVTIDEGVDYALRVIADGQTIVGFVDGGSTVSYASAASNETETVHGLTCYYNAGSDDDEFDNYAIYPRTSSVYDATLDVAY